MIQTRVKVPDRLVAHLAVLQKTHTLDVWFRQLPVANAERDGVDQLVEILQITKANEGSG